MTAAVLALDDARRQRRARAVQATHDYVATAFLIFECARCAIEARDFVTARHAIDEALDETPPPDALPVAHDWRRARILETLAALIAAQIAPA